MYDASLLILNNSSECYFMIFWKVSARKKNIFSVLSVRLSAFSSLLALVFIDIKVICSYTSILLRMNNARSMTNTISKVLKKNHNLKIITRTSCKVE